MSWRWRKFRTWLWMNTHRPIEPTLYQQMAEESGVLDEIIPIGLIDVVYYLDENGTPMVQFRGEDPDGNVLDLLTMYGMLDMARDAAKDAAAEQ